MATHAQQILEYLRTHPDGADDTVLAGVLGVRHAAVNRVCLRLAKKGINVRDHVSGARNLVNRLADQVAEPIKLPGHPQPPTPVIITAGPVRLVSLDSEATLRQFAYAGEVGLLENQVKLVMKELLEADGWKVSVQLGNAHGIDIDARRVSERLVIEAKGERALKAGRGEAFLSGLGQIVQLMDSPAACYGLAFAAHWDYVRPVLALPPWITERLALRFYFVRPAPGGGYEVGLIKEADIHT